MKRINLIFGLLCVFNFSISYAEDGDRLSHLSKTLSEGSYTHPANLESTTLREKLEDKQRKTEFEDVPRSELKKLGMSPAYGDSIIKKDADKNEYFEIKEFPDGNYMYRTLSQK
jgi:topoisomerase IA-like protein